MEDNPFEDLKIDPQGFLDVMDGRTSCPKCGKSRKYFCYTCYVPVLGIEDNVPKVKLPFKIDIIKHPSECDGKSTSGHARVIAPDDVTIYTYPCIPDYPDPDRVVLLFPGDGSIDMAALAEKFSPPLLNNRQQDNKKDEHSDTSEEENVVVNPCHEKAPSDGDQPCVEADQNISSPDRNPGLGDEFDHTFTKSLSDCGDNILRADTDIPRADTDIPRADTDIPQADIDIPWADTDIPQQKGVNPANSKRKRLVEDEEVERSKFMSGEKLEFKPPFDRLIIIDSTWNQTRRISSDERLKGLTCVELQTRHSNFWRHQKDLPLTYLSTIEAIYYFTRDYHDAFCDGTVYDGRYDNLLFFFTYMYNKIQKIYGGGKNLKAFLQREGKKKPESKV